MMQMLKNYLKIAVKVLLRRKLFTLISLFGISFTTMILIIISAEVNSLIAPAAPEVNLNRTLFLRFILFTYDKGMAMGNPSYYFLDRYVRPLNTPEKISFYSSQNIIIYKYLQNKRAAVNLKYTDSNFWSIMKFEFVEGRPYLKSDVDNINYYAVISEKTSKGYFGNKSAIGKPITLDDVTYRVAGVVRDVNKGRASYADVWVPLTTGKYDLKDPDYSGFEAMILAKDKDDFKKIQDEFYGKLKYVQSSDNSVLKKVTCPLKPYSDWLEGGRILGVRIFKDNYAPLENENWLNFGNTIIVFMSFFILLPVLNLIYMNLTRISERASEISIRKSFGASSITLTGQFIIENLVLTALGGVTGFLMAIAGISILNNSEYFESGLKIDLTIGLYGLAFIFLFGLLSGVYPAYKMSRLNPVEGLRGGQGC